jgi:hypothetical protein
VGRARSRHRQALTQNGKRLLISERRPREAALSLAERIEIDLTKLRQDHPVLKLARRRIAGAGKCQSPACSRASASPAFGYDWTHELTSFTRLQAAFRVPIDAMTTC